MTTLPPAALQAERVAILFRRIVLLVGGQLLGLVPGLMLAAAAASVHPAAGPILGLLVLAAALVSSVACAVCTYEITRELGTPAPWQWAIAIVIPCVNLFVLLGLSQRAHAWCKERGIRVGLLGPTRESIEQLERQSSVDRILK